MQDAIELHGVDAYHSVYFSVPQIAVRTRRCTSAGLPLLAWPIPALSHLKIMLNDSLFATLPVVTNVNMTGTYAMGGSPTNEGTILAPQNEPIVVTQNSNGVVMDAVLQMPAEMLVRDNHITSSSSGTR